MKCLNPECESIEANALNISINVSMTKPDQNIVWDGYTDFAPGSISPTLGTICSECDQEWWVPNYMERITSYIDRDGNVGRHGGITSEPVIFIVTNGEDN